MKIVNIEDWFIPDTGYQINIIPKYLAKFGHEVYIVTSKTEGIKKTSASFFGVDDIEKRDEEFTAKTGVKIIRVNPFSKAVVSGRIIQGNELFKTVDSLNPDVVYVHGNDTLTGIMYLMKKRKFAIVTDSHMLKMASTNKFSTLFQKMYKKIVTPKILKNNIQVIRTQDDDYVESCLGIPLSQSPWISYGTDMTLFHPDEEVKKMFREENGIPQDDFVFVYTGKTDEAKGGKLLAEAFLKKFNTKKQVTLIIVGTFSGEYGKEVENIFKKSENRIVHFPTQKYYDLAKFYQAADASVFARQCSLSFYDAQGCGLPVISEDNNINVDRNSHGNGLCFESESAESFRAKIEELLNMPETEYKKMSDNAYSFITDNYNYEDKAREYEKIIIDSYKAFCKGE